MFIRKLKLLCVWALHVLKTLLTLPLSVLYRRQNIVIVCERGTDARDNGFCFFRYLFNTHPEINAYYIISKDSPDLPKVISHIPDKKRIVYYKSLKHCLYYYSAKLLISAHLSGASPCLSFDDHFKIFRSPGRQVFLQHGIIKNDHPVLYYNPKRHIALFCSGAVPEYEYLKAHFGYPEGIIQLTGLARFDYLVNMAGSEKMILVMPTWRKYCARISSEAFLETDYFKYWKELLHDERLLSHLREHNVKLIFYPHHEMQHFIDCFDSADEAVIIANSAEYDVQDLLKRTSLLITDFSSVFFDVAYLQKPLAYYQFDQEEFNRGHYEKGYFDYERDGFGPVFTGADGLISYIIGKIDAGFENDPCYLDRINKFFIGCDHNNCERIYTAIKPLIDG